MIILLTGLLSLVAGLKPWVHPITRIAHGGDMRQVMFQGPSKDQLAALERLKRASGTELVIRWNEKNWTPAFLSGRLGKVENRAPSAINKARARKLKLLDGAMKDVGSVEFFLRENRLLLRIIDPARELVLATYERDSLGMSHIRFDQLYKAIRVWSADLIVHIDREGQISSLTGNLEPTPGEIRSVRERITARQAIRLAISDLEKTVEVEPIPPDINRTMKYSGPVTEKVIFYERDSGVPHLAWLVKIRPNVLEHWYYFVDCFSSEILFKYNATARN